MTVTEKSRVDKKDISSSLRKKNLMEIDIEELAKFLVRTKLQTDAGSGREIPPQRPGFKELEFKEGDWEYRDSYAGFFFAPGQKVVRFEGRPVWMLAYSGGMTREHIGDIEFAERTFAFLKQALSRVEESRPFRGPDGFTYESSKDKTFWLYKNSSEGDITNFEGTEQIFCNKKEVFRQYYIGGLIIPKKQAREEIF